MTRIFELILLQSLFTSFVVALNQYDGFREGYRVSTKQGSQRQNLDQLNLDHHLKGIVPSINEYSREKSDIIADYVNYVNRQDKGLPRDPNSSIDKRHDQHVNGRKRQSYSMVDRMVRSSSSTLSRYVTPTYNSIISKRVGRGLVTCDFGGSTMSHSWTHQPVSTTAGSCKHEPTDANVKVSSDISTIFRLIPVIIYVISSSGSAFMGTLRLLAPLVVARRALCILGNLISDWYTGRTLRKTYTRLERIYIHYYETPAMFRALTRTISQWLVYLILARAFGWFVGQSHAPCRSKGRGLAFICGLLWIGSVVGTGHAFATAVSLWGGPLRLQAALHPERSSVLGFFSNPWNLVQWMHNPEEWIRLISIPERRRFVPNPIIFPATWVPLRLLQMVAVAKVAATEPDQYVWCSSTQDQIPKLMNKYFLQLSLGDEWQRVFLREKRVGLGIFLAVAYALSMIPLLISSAMLNGKMTLLMVPSMIAIIVSGWMNIVIYYNRYKIGRNKSIQSTVVNGLFEQP